MIMILLKCYFFILFIKSSCDPQNRQTTHTRYATPRLKSISLAQCFLTAWLWPSGRHCAVFSGPQNINQNFFRDHYLLLFCYYFLLLSFVVFCYFTVLCKLIDSLQKDTKNFIFSIYFHFKATRTIFNRRYGHLYL